MKKKLKKKIQRQIHSKVCQYIETGAESCETIFDHVIQERVKEMKQLFN